MRKEKIEGFFYQIIYIISAEFDYVIFSILSTKKKKKIDR